MAKQLEKRHAAQYPVLTKLICVPVCAYCAPKMYFNNHILTLIYLEKTFLHCS